MSLLTRTHKFILWFLILVSVFSLAVLLYIDYRKGEVLSTTDSKTVTVTGDIPHIIAIQIKPESRIPPAGNDELPLEIEIRPPGSLIPVTTISVTATSSGDASLGTISSVLLPPGTYDIAIKGLSHLRKVFPNQNFDGPVVRTYTLTLPQLPAGDANPTADNYVNSLDISYLTLKLYGNDLRADLTHDGTVNSLDYAALLRNLSASGDN